MPAGASRVKVVTADVCDSTCPLLGGARLRSALGFNSGEAFRTAVRSGRVPVPLMKIAGRKGWFAQLADVTRWLESLTAVEPNPGGAESKQVREGSRNDSK